jgi:hypothetical protein
MAGKGPRQRPTDMKKYKENYPLPSNKKVEGFVRVKGKQTKVYK